MTRGPPPLRPRARAAFTFSRTRWRISLRSISANAAWICKKARPARGGVNRRVEGAEPDAPLVDLIDEGDELAGSPPQPIGVEDDEDIVLAQVIEAGGKVRTLGRASGDTVLEHTLATGVFERVERAVEHLAAFGGGDAGVAGEAHGACGPDNPSQPRILS